MYTEEELENLVEQILQRHIGWRFPDYKIPVCIKSSTRFMANISFDYYQGVYYEANNGSSLKRSSYTPENITINKNILDNNDDRSIIRNLILHELCHWITMEKYGCNVNSHGKEFKKTGREIGLPDAYNRARTPIHEAGITSGIPYHIGRCTECGKVVGRYRRKSTIMKKCTPDYVSSCCRAKIEYAGIVQDPR